MDSQKYYLQQADPMMELASHAEVKSGKGLGRRAQEYLTLAVSPESLIPFADRHQAVIMTHRRIRTRSIEDKEWTA